MVMPSLQADFLKADFPILARKVNGHSLVYLDNAATTQKPMAVIEAMVNFYENHNANVHRGVHTLSEEATGLYESARKTVARFIGAASTRQVVFTRGTTDSLNMIAQGLSAHLLEENAEILLTEMEHHSNLVPWQMAARARGASLRYVRVGGDGLLDEDDFQRCLERRPKIVALTYVSNVLGTINPLQRLIAECHQVGAIVVVDAAQAVQKIPLNVAELDCDFLAFSGHKVYGPGGIGVLYGRESLLRAMEPPWGGGGMILSVSREGSEWGEIPWKFEPGTPNVAGAVGLAAALDYLERLDLALIRERERELTAHMLKALAKISAVAVFGLPAGEGRSGVVSFNLQGVHPHDVAEVLDETGVAVRGGHHCCQVLMERLGVPATTRASLALYNTVQDVERLVEGLGRARRLFTR